MSPPKNGGSLSLPCHANVRLFVHFNGTVNTTLPGGYSQQDGEGRAPLNENLHVLIRHFFLSCFYISIDGKPKKKVENYFWWVTPLGAWRGLDIGNFFLFSGGACRIGTKDRPLFSSLWKSRRVDTPTFCSTWNPLERFFLLLFFRIRHRLLFFSSFLWCLAQIESNVEAIGQRRMLCVSSWVTISTHTHTGGQWKQNTHTLYFLTHTHSSLLLLLRVSFVFVALATTSRRWTCNMERDSWPNARIGSMTSNLYQGMAG